MSRIIKILRVSSRSLFLRREPSSPCSVYCCGGASLPHNERSSCTISTVVRHPHLQSRSLTSRQRSSPFRLNQALLHIPGKPGTAMKRIRVNWRQCNTSDTVERDMSKPSGPSPGDKNKYNQCASRRKLSEIKLKRTDTTLDLSQYCEEVSKVLDSGGNG